MAQQSRKRTINYIDWEILYFLCKNLLRSTTKNILFQHLYLDLDDYVKNWGDMAPESILLLSTLFETSVLSEKKSEI